MASMLVRLAAFVTIVAICLVPSSASAAASVPPSASHRRSAGFGSAEIRNVLAASRGLSFRKLVAVDLDRDGDLDVLASTDRGVLLWLNDGHGHLVFQQAAGNAALTGASPANTWRERQEPSFESVQTEPPSLDSTFARSHAPPARPMASTLSGAADLPADSASALLATRAPPL